VVEDRPSGGSVLADRWADAVVQLEALLEEGAQAAHEALQAAGSHGHAEQLRRRLLAAQAAFNAALRSYLFDLQPCEALDGLERLGSERGGEWRPWQRAVETAVNDCRLPLSELMDSLTGCWNELAERSGVMPVVAWPQVNEHQEVADVKVDARRLAPGGERGGGVRKS
jgi:hypothetical protein